jgi:hypothetical protein
MPKGEKTPKGTKRGAKAKDNLKAFHDGLKAGKPAALEKEKKRVKHIKETAAKTRAEAQLLETMRDALLQPDKDGATPASDIIQGFVKIARQNKESKNAFFLMSAMGLDEKLDIKLDKWLDKMQSKDIAFQEYRVLKLLHDKQRAAVSSIARQQLWYPGRRWGKTYAGAAKLIIDAGIHGWPCLYAHRSFEKGISQLWPNVLQIAGDAGVPIEKSEIGKGLITFKSGGTVEILGARDRDQQEAIRGSVHGWHTIIVDEFFFLKNQKYLVEDVLKLTLAEWEGNQLILSCSPPRIVDKYFEKLHETFVNVTGDMRDNTAKPNLRSEYDAALKEYGASSSTFQREWAGLWVPDKDAIVFNPSAPFTLENPTGVISGLDWGYEDPTVIVVVAFSVPQRKCEVIYEDMWRQTGAQESTERLLVGHEKALEYAKAHNLPTQDVIVISDNSDKQIAEDLFYQYKIPVYYAYKTHFMLGIHRVADDVSMGKLSLPMGGHCREECDKIVYKRDEMDNIIDEIDDDTFHPNAMIALKYAMTQIYTKFGVPLAEKSDVVGTNPRAPRGDNIRVVGEREKDNAVIKSSGTIKMTKVR